MATGRDGSISSSTASRPSPTRRSLPPASTAKGGYFGALNLAADITERFKVPQTGGRPTDPSWTERRQLPLRPETLERLEKLAMTIREHGGGEIHPMQLAALLLEKATASISDEDALGLVGRAR
jgi:hypothetical protein